MFGPVIISMRRSSFRVRSLGINGPVWYCSTTGCRPALILIPGVSEKAGGFRSRLSARSAKAVRTSISAAAAAHACNCTSSRHIVSSIDWYSCFSRARALLCALSTRSSKFFSSSVINRSVDFRVCLRWYSSGTCSLCCRLISM